MTLPELLIVVAIIGVLAVTVLPALSTTSEARRTREAARVTSGFCARAQSGAIGKRDWFGLLLAPLAGTLTVAELRLAAVPPPYAGATLDARVAIQPGTSPINSGTAIALPASACPVLNATPTSSPLELSDIANAAVNVQPQDLIQFDGEGPSYEIVSASTTEIIFRNRDGVMTTSAGFDTANRPWPAATPATHAFEIFRRPALSGQPFSIPNNRVIDLRWSGYGPSNDPLASSYVLFNSAGQAISILFDATGRMRLIMRGGNRVVPQHPVYLLVGRPDRVGNVFSSSLSASDDSVGANWQYADSWWIAFDPLTGAVRSAECRPNASTVTDSQSFIRNQF
jgi:prepilin-type N-terminal cleavage/methylation domain-containing protein